MSTAQSTYSVAMPSLSPPAPPTDLGTYSRSMHQHTKRQMEAISQSPPPARQTTRSQQPSSSVLPDGVAGRSRNNPPDYRY